MNLKATEADKFTFTFNEFVEIHQTIEELGIEALADFALAEYIRLGNEILATKRTPFKFDKKEMKASIKLAASRLKIIEF